MLQGDISSVAAIRQGALASTTLVSSGAQTGQDPACGVCAMWVAILLPLTPSPLHAHSQCTWTTPASTPTTHACGGTTGRAPFGCAGKLMGAWRLPGQGKALCTGDDGKLLPSQAAQNHMFTSCLTPACACQTGMARGAPVTRSSRWLWSANRTAPRGRGRAASRWVWPHPMGCLGSSCYDTPSFWAGGGGQGGYILHS